MNKEITIYDIAQVLDISPATVSRALNNHEAISNNTKTLIKAKAEEMGYRSNKFASNLRKQKTNTIGVIVPRLNSPLMSTVLAGMEKVANEAGYNLLISQSLESYKKEVSNIKTMFNSRVDGLLVSVAYDTEGFSHFEPFIKKSVPLIFFDRVLEHNDCLSIIIDNFKGGYDATKHLIEIGCKKIIHITGSLQRNVYAERLRGFKEALIDKNLSFDKSQVFETDLSPDIGKQIANKIKAEDLNVDGIFITNDFCAASCIGELKRIGYKIPDDIAVVGFNNDPVSEVIEPKLTTVHYPGKEMGEIAAKCMINHLNGLMDIGQTNLIMLKSELIVRDSTQR
ncbi:MAG: LacI family transcriptional regulator [Spirosomaceae bacterium]|jgi:LacI family transcriptional regulator|nr:LacI family transcriptional regulator [Spirosomataceae bacterium]